MEVKKGLPDRNGVKAGYKQTEVGVIPGDWHTDKIQNLAQITTGSKNTQDRIEAGEFPFFVRSQTIERINSYSFEGEAVLTAGDGVGTGKVFHYINGKFDFHQRVYKISNFKDTLDGYYFFLFFSNNFYNRIMQMTAKSSVDSVRMEMIADMQIPLPPTKAEQTAIATALSNADALIQSLEKLIAKKRLIKQGAMQKLLKPREGWVVKKLGKICDFQNGTSLERFFNKNEGYSVISIGNYSSSGKYVETNTFIDKVHSDEIAKFLLKKNELTLLMNDKTSIGTIIGRVLLIEQGDKYVFNQRTMRLKPKNNYNFLFLYHLINSDFIHKKIVLLAKPGTQIYVNTNDIIDLELFIPKPEEQIRIATILSDMDAEIAAMETKLAKYKQVKQGMMQELLTGRTRLV